MGRKKALHGSPEHASRCSRSSGCLRLPPMRALAEPPTLPPSRSGCKLARSTEARSTGSWARGRGAPCARCNAGPESPSTGSRARRRSGRSGATRGTASATACCTTETAAGTSPRSSSSWPGTVFPSGTFDGVLGPHADAALRRFQRWAGLGADGIARPRDVPCAPPWASLMSPTGSCDP